MYSLSYTNKFKKDLKRCAKRGYPMNELRDVLDILIETGKLPPQYHQHKLSGKYDGCWECHIQPDWLLVWKEYADELILVLTNTGTHADIF